MKRNILLEHLRLAEHHAAEGERHLAHQEQVVAELDQHGHDTREAIKVLATLRETQRLHQEDVGRILGELGNHLQE
jgi:hypothetical protein